ncbi:MAG TPA: glycosyltransferase family 2 protein [Gemmatimonadota bacterium]|nr:glycosyltransferase family 2 protein [Gemmatimonadota bacterium]
MDSGARVAGSKLVAVIPAYNEAGHIGAVVHAVRQFADDVVVVDDGSSDATGAEARAAGARVYRHLVNRGLGGGLATGLRAALRAGAEIIVTLDGDGQHVPSEVLDVAGPIRKGAADFVIGSRMLDPQGMPLSRRVANRLANLCTWILFGVHVSDTQSGFRAFSRRVAESIDLRTSRMEVSSEIVAEVARHGFRIVEVPITVIYTDYSLSKGQSLGVGLQTLVKLILRRSR